MKLNNIAIEKYGGSFISFLPASTDVVSNLVIGNVNHLETGLEIKTQTRDLIIVFEKEFDMSFFTKELLKRFEIQHEDYLFDCLLINTPDVVYIGRGIIEVTYHVSAICKKPLITVREPIFHVEGTYRANCIYEITALNTLEVFTVDGYTVHHLQANEKLIIDGINKLVYYEQTPDQSAFDDIDMTEFPKLEIGAHEIMKTDSNVEVVVKYYPIYL